MKTTSLLLAASVAALIMVPASAESSSKTTFDFGSPAVELDVGGMFTNIAGTYADSNKIALNGTNVKLAFRDGYQSSWGGFIRLRGTVGYYTASDEQSSALNFCTPTDVNTCTGVGKVTYKAGGGFNYGLSVEPGFAFNRFIGIYGIVGYDCQRVGWSANWDYNKMYETWQQSHSVHMCGFPVGGGVEVHIPHLDQVSFSIYGTYKYADDSREHGGGSSYTYANGPTMNSFTVGGRIGISL
jgi:opacity protein-like surface antigen